MSDDVTRLKLRLAKVEAKLTEYRQAAFVATDMDRDDPQDMIRFMEATLQRIDDLTKQLAAMTSERDALRAAYLKADHVGRVMRDERDAARTALREIFDRVPYDVAWMLEHKADMQRWRKAAGEAT